MRKHELPALTGIRFYFALLVFLSHASVIPGMEKFSGANLFFNAGVVGVSCFFVLSGFILTYNYASVFQNGVSTTGYKRFVWDRWTKIYPVHFAAFLAALPIQIYSPNLPLDWRAVPFHLLLLQCWWPLSKPTFNNYLNVPSWSISCEWFFYLVAPFAIFFVRGSARRWFLVLGLLVYASGIGWFLLRGTSDFTRLYLVSWFAPSRLPEFLAGVVIAQMYLTRPLLKSELTSCLAQLAGFILIVAGAMYRGQAPWPFWGGLLYVPGAALFVLGLSYGRGLLAAHLSRPWINRLGMASFCFYMIQAPILRATKGILIELGWEAQSWFGFWCVFVVMFVMIQITALLMHKDYELWIQRRLRGLAFKISEPKMALPSQAAR
jgi:peptidoglycan/LPS O-acetylase OafA/YrhL